MDQVFTEAGMAETPRVTAFDLLAQADAMRDQRAWEAAAAAYATYLELHPADWGIRVQYGHCIKESGDPAGALAAYRDAERLAPDDSDVHLQIGHALKLLGRPEEAYAEYCRALELDPDSPAARAEVAALRHFAPPDQRRTRSPGAPLQIVFDVSDLIAYCRDNRAPTGIQRVQLNITAQALRDPPEDVVPAVCAFDAASGFWREVDREAFLRLWRLSGSGAATDDPAWRDAVETILRGLGQGTDFPFVPGACLVNLGTSWWIKDYFLRVRHLQRRHGVRYVPFVHDCIPLLVPEHCPPALVREFAHWFASLALHADAFIANSECTRDDARRQLAALLPGLDLPSAVVPLDADMRQDHARAAPAARGPRGREEPFVLFVGTIEARKNHLLVFNAWLTLMRRHGAAAVPRLVCVGKPGWLAEPAMQLYANSAALRSKVSILHGVSDARLAAFYENCLFTVYNSFYEGWGLPVTESLSFGRVALVPRHSSLPQAGGEHAVYFLHQSEPDLVEKLETLIFDPAHRGMLEGRIAARLRLRDWGAITDQLLQELLTAERAEPVPLEQRHAIRLGAPQPLRLFDESLPTLAMAAADAVRDGLGWHQLEDWGVWTRPGRATLRIPLGAAGARAGAPLRLYLDCVAPPGDLALGIRAAPPYGPAATIEVRADSRFTCVLDPLDGAEAIEVEFDSGAGVELAQDHPPRRSAGIGLTGFMLCRRDDLESRLEFLERTRFRTVAIG